MSDFKVTQIIDPNTVEVYPEWSFEDESGKEFNDNIVRILNSTIPITDEYAKRRLTVLLLNRKVELVNPVVIKYNSAGIPEIACKVIIDKTDLSYYFPEYFSYQEGNLEYRY